MPEHFIVSPYVVTQEGNITTVGDKTCGEIEFFFLEREGHIYVGVTSEHTDRALEAVDMIKSKAICQKPVSRQLWRYEDIKEHWDSIQLTAWQAEDGKEEIIYQNSPLSSLLSLEDIREEALKLYSNLEDCIIFSGTIPTVGGLLFGSRFRGEMRDSVLQRSLAFDYTVKTVPADSK